MRGNVEVLSHWTGTIDGTKDRAAIVACNTRNITCRFTNTSRASGLRHSSDDPLVSIVAFCALTADSDTQRLAGEAQ